MKPLVCIDFKTLAISSVAIWLRKAQIGELVKPCVDFRPRDEEWGGQFCLIVDMLH